MSERLTPRYLTVNQAMMIVGMVLDGIVMSPYMEPILKRRACHIVILVPSQKDAREKDYPNWPNYPLTPAVLYEHSEGKGGEEWTHDFDQIARCKALQLWNGQNKDGNTDTMKHLLFPGDTPFWGGVKRQGIVVACSGVQPYFDQMISGMIADALIAFAQHTFEICDRGNEDFID